MAITISNPYGSLEYQTLLKDLEDWWRYIGGGLEIKASSEVVSNYLAEKNIRATPAKELLELGYPVVAGNPVAEARGLSKTRKAAKAEATGPVQENFIICGGLKEFHLHCDGEIYLLNSRQVQELSKRLFEQNLIKLRKVNKIHFEDVVTLNDLLENMTRK